MDTKKPTDAPTKTVDDFVAEHINNVTVREDGTFDIPDDVPENAKYAITAEKRRRDAQSTLGKTQGQLDKIQAENVALKEQLGTLAKPQLSVEQTTELDALKFSDPDAWFALKTQYEDQSMRTHNENVNTATSAASFKVELARRHKYNEAFALANNGFVITKELLLDVPPRITSKLDEGADYEEWVNEVYAYANKGKVVANQKVDNVADLNKSGGQGHLNDKEAVDYTQLAKNNKEIF